MMRKDVRLGFAVGGVLLAVIVAYVLVVPGGKSPDGAQLATGPETNPAETPLVDGAPGPTPTLPADPAVPKTEIAGAKPVANDPFRNEPPGGNREAAPPARSGGQDLWASLLNNGKAPALAASKEVRSNDAQVAGADKPTTEIVPTAVVPDSSTGPSLLAAQTDVRTNVRESSTPSTRPSALGQKVHVVQAGESLAKIAYARLGSEALWPEIQRANNNVDPKKLKAGTPLIIPDLGTLVAAEKAKPQPANAPATPAADGRTTYQVLATDSLYRISKKLYGTGDRVGAIYDLNKEAIGADPAKLKLNMILKLPAAPQAVTSAER